MPGKESKFRSLTASKETIKKFARIAERQEMTPGKLLEIMTENEALIPLFLKKFAKAKISGPFVRKNGNKLEKYFLVDKEEVVTDEWTNIENAKAVRITEQ